MDEQTVFNAAVAIAGCLGGWALRVLWDSLKELQADNKQITRRVSEIEVLVAGAYVKKSDYQHDIDKIVHKLDNIASQMSGKVDR